MRRVPQILLGFLACCSMLALTGSQSIAEEKVSSARRLPPQVYAYFTVRNTVELKQRFGETLFGQMLKEPQLAAVGEQVKDAIFERAAEVEEQLGVKIDDLLALPQGEIAVAVVQPPGGKLSIVVMLDFGDKRETLDKLIAKAVENLEEKEITRSTEDYQENEIVIFSKGDGENEEDGADPDKTIAYCIKDSVLVAGNRPDAIKLALVRWDGQHDSTLMSNEVFRYLSEKCGNGTETRPLMTWFVDPIGLLRAGLTASPQAPPQAMMVMGFLPLLGLDKFKAIGGTLDMVTGEFDTVSRTMIYMEPPTTGLLKAFRFPAEAQRPPSWVTADATSFSTVNWAIEDAYKAVESLADTFQGPGALSLMLDKLSEGQFNGDLHLKDDILDVLTGQVRIFSDVPDGDKPMGARSLYALEVNDADAAKATLAKLAAIEGFPGESREFRGQTIYELPAFPEFNQFGGVEDEEDEDAEEKMSGYAVVKDHLMFADNVTLLEKVIRGGGEADKLADTAAYKQIAAHFPEKTSAVGYQKENVDFKKLYEAIRSGNAEFLIGDAFSDIDFTELPKFDEIRGFMPPSGSFMVPDERGLVIQSFTLKKEQ